MALFKRGKVYWFEFWFNGQRVRQSTKTSNKKAAFKIEAAERTKLALGKAGLEAPELPDPETNQSPDTQEPAALPTLTEFAPDFRKHVKLRNAEKPETIRFYLSKLDRLLEYAPLARASLDAIDDTLVEAYVTHRVNKGLQACDRQPGARNPAQAYAVGNDQAQDHKVRPGV